MKSYREGNKIPLYDLLDRSVQNTAIRLISKALRVWHGLVDEVGLHSPVLDDLPNKGQPRSWSCSLCTGIVNVGCPASFWVD